MKLPEGWRYQLKFKGSRKRPVHVFIHENGLSKGFSWIEGSRQEATYLFFQWLKELHR